MFSPSRKAFSGLLSGSINKHPPSIQGATTCKSDQLAKARLPMVQKLSERSSRSSATYVSSPVPAPAIALIAMPASSKLATGVEPSLRANCQVASVTSSPPPNAASGNARRPNRALQPANSESPSTMNATAASAAPLDTPSKPASASGLRKSPCRAAPAGASDAPTSKPSNRRGNRNSHTTMRSAAVARSASHRVFHNCVIPSSTGPLIMDTSATASNKATSSKVKPVMRRSDDETWISCLGSVGERDSVGMRVWQWQMFGGCQQFGQRHRQARTHAQQIHAVEHGDALIVPSGSCRHAWPVRRIERTRLGFRHYNQLRLQCQQGFLVQRFVAFDVLRQVGQAQCVQHFLRLGIATGHHHAPVARRQQEQHRRW